MEKNSQIAEAKIAVIVSGNTLDIDGISQQLKLTPTRVIHKGDVVGHIPAPLLAGEDQWIYAQELSDCIGTDSILNQLLVELNSVRDHLQALAAEHAVSLQLYVKSDHAHMFYRLMPETLGHLVSLGIPLEISSFSWGGL